MTKKVPDPVKLVTVPIWEVLEPVQARSSRNKAPRSGPIMCEAMLPDDLNRIYAHFTLLNKDSVVKSTLQSVDRPLSVTTADVRK